MNVIGGFCANVFGIFGNGRLRVRGKKSRKSRGIRWKGRMCVRAGIASKTKEVRPTYLRLRCRECSILSILACILALYA